MGRPPRIAALVLAAGRSTRMGGRNKLCCDVDGVPMVRRVVDAALASRCEQTLVITGYDAEAVATAIGEAPVTLVHNANHAEGIAASLRCGLRAVSCNSDGAVIVLGDMPWVSAEHIDALIAAFDPVAPSIVAPQRDGRRGNPVLWPYRYFDAILALHGDQGARDLLKRHAATMTLVTVDDDAIFTDVDNPEDLERPPGSVE